MAEDYLKIIPKKQEEKGSDCSDDQDDHSQHGAKSNGDSKD